MARDRGGRPPRRQLGHASSTAADRVNQLRNNNAIPSLDAQQIEDEQTIARILARDSVSAIGQHLGTGVQRLSNQLANIRRARNNIRDMDAILSEIEQF